MDRKTNTLCVIALCLLAIAGGTVLLNRKKDDAPPASSPANSRDTRRSDRQGGSPPSAPGGIDSPESPEELAAKRELALVERDNMTAMWMKNASTGFQHTRKNLIADLDLSDGEATELEKIFARRDKELSALLDKMASGEAGNDKETFRKITALLRNKGLRDDLVGVLTKERLAAFDAKEAKRERETAEARAYRDMADLNSVVQLSDTQKQEALGALMKSAPEKVEHEADARAFMSLTYGPLANEMESAAFRGLTNLVHDGLMGEGASPDIGIDSPEYGKRAEEQKAQRIESELAGLRGVLDEKQLTRYREHLEKEPPW